MNGKFFCENVSLCPSRLNSKACLGFYGSFMHDSCCQGDPACTKESHVRLPTTPSKLQSYKQQIPVFNFLAPNLWFAWLSEKMSKTYMDVGRSENLEGRLVIGGHNLPPGWDRVNWSAKIWECQAMAPPAPPAPTGLHLAGHLELFSFFTPF